MRILVLLLTIASLTFATIACQSRDKADEKSEEGGEGAASEGEEASGEESTDEAEEDPAGEESTGEAEEDSPGEEAERDGGEDPVADDDEDPVGEEAVANTAGTDESPSEGDSCEGLVSSADALMACNGQKLMFCSSYSNYKWQTTQVCPEGKTCTVSKDMNQGSCK